LLAALAPRAALPSAPTPRAIAAAVPIAILY